MEEESQSMAETLETPLLMSKYTMVYIHHVNSHLFFNCSKDQDYACYDVEIEEPHYSISCTVDPGTGRGLRITVYPCRL